MKKDKKPSDYIEALRKLKHAGLSGSPNINRISNNAENLPTIKERVDNVLGIVNNPNRPNNHMLFFVMYDITSDKVRNNVVKYLERHGCFRIQKSIFLADLDTEIYEKIKSDLAEVNSLYENYDSIIVCPISTDLIKSMKVIGQSVDIDIITKSKNTLFF